MCKIVILIVAALALASAQVTTQTVAPTAGPAPTVTPAVACSAANLASINWNNTALFGKWEELTRTPIGNAMACMEYTTALENDNTTLSISAAHSSSATSVYRNVTQKATVTLVKDATTGYSVTFTENNVAQTPVFIKLLNFYDNNYIIGCGYTNATNASTSYGFLLGRAGNTTTGGIQTANKYAATLCTNFNSPYGTILQDGCRDNSAGQSLPFIGVVLGLALMLINAH